MESLNYTFAEALGTPLDRITAKDSINPYLGNCPTEQIGDQYYITNQGMGIGFVFDALRSLKAIHLYSSLKKGHSQFNGPMPYGIEFSNNEAECVKKIGLKDFALGGGEILPILGPVNKWRKYLFSNCYLTLEFDQNIKLVMVTIGK